MSRDRRTTTGQQVTTRLIVRRVKRLRAGTVPAGQGTLFDTWRYHAAFTDSPLALRDAERDHRRHAVVEQVIADVKNSGFAPLHLPERWPWSKDFTQLFSTVHAPPPSDAP
ncbi:hypothetical protein [Streptomyces variegatus]|uniref:hypothetical protein n=1 Tax=Streptomyces variegatus TaxID=284040 RepID=UPI003C2F8251